MSHYIVTSQKCFLNTSWMEHTTELGGGIRLQRVCPWDTNSTKCHLDTGSHGTDNTQRSPCMTGTARALASPCVAVIHELLT